MLHSPQLKNKIVLDFKTTKLSPNSSKHTKVTHIKHAQGKTQSISQSSSTTQNTKQPQTQPQIKPIIMKITSKSPYHVQNRKKKKVRKG